MKYIDLHVHSLFSDGTCTPEELVDKASAQGLVAFALTDHDTVGGVDRALAAAKDKHLQVIPGVELSLSLIHISGKMSIYGICEQCIDIKI